MSDLRMSPVAPRPGDKIETQARSSLIESSQPFLWLATVDCIAADGPAHRMKILFQAGRWPMEQAWLHVIGIAEEKAPLGPKWVQFEAREMVKIELPWLVADSRWTDSSDGKSAPRERSV